MTTEHTSPFARMVAAGLKRTFTNIRTSTSDTSRVGNVLNEAMADPEVQEDGAALIAEESQRFLTEISDNAGGVVRDINSRLNPDGHGNYELIRSSISRDGDGTLKKIGKTFVSGALNIGTGIMSFVTAKAVDLFLRPSDPIDSKELHSAMAGGIHQVFNARSADGS